MTSSRLTLGCLIGAVLSVSIAVAEEPYDITTRYSSELTPMVKSDAVSIMAVDARGITQSHHDDKAFDNNTVHCVGVWKSMSGTVTTHGYCKYLDTDGDITVGRFSPEGAKGRMGVYPRRRKMAGHNRWWYL